MGNDAWVCLKGKWSSLFEVAVSKFRSALPALSPLSLSSTLQHPVIYSPLGTQEAQSESHLLLSLADSFSSNIWWLEYHAILGRTCADVVPGCGTVRVIRLGFQNPPPPPCFMRLIRALSQAVTGTHPLTKRLGVAWCLLGPAQSTHD